jgi:hypothetical protein
MVDPASGPGLSDGDCVRIACSSSTRGYGRTYMLSLEIRRSSSDASEVEDIVLLRVAVSSIDWRNQTWGDVSDDHGRPNSTHSSTKWSIPYSCGREAISSLGQVPRLQILGSVFTSRPRCLTLRSVLANKRSFERIKAVCWM